MPFFTQLFLLALAAGTILQLWLLARQTRHVVDHREKVPEEFSGKVELDDHQKAADYTGAKAGIARLEVIFSTLLLLVWTLGGGLELFSRFWNSLGFDALLTGVAFIFSVFLSPVYWICLFHSGAPSKSRQLLASTVPPWVVFSKTVCWVRL